MKFRDLEREPFLEGGAQESCALDEWYMSVRDIPIKELAVGDVCRALRQDLFVRYVLPVSVVLLSDDILAGDRYDGELIVALAGLNEAYWCESAGVAIQIRELLDGLKGLSSDRELLKDASGLIEKLGNFKNGE